MLVSVNITYDVGHVQLCFLSIFYLLFLQGRVIRLIDKAYLCSFCWSMRVCNNKFTPNAKVLGTLEAENTKHSAKD